MYHEGILKCPLCSNLVRFILFFHSEIYFRQKNSQQIKVEKANREWKKGKRKKEKRKKRKKGKKGVFALHRIL